MWTVSHWQLLDLCELHPLHFLAGVRLGSLGAYKGAKLVGGSGTITGRRAG